MGNAGNPCPFLPVTLMSLVIISLFPKFASLEASGNQKKAASAGTLVKENWNAFAKIAIIVSGRSIIFFGLNIFIPIYWIHVLNQSKVAGATALTIFAGAGFSGT